MTPPDAMRAATGAPTIDAVMVSEFHHRVCNDMSSAVSAIELLQRAWTKEDWTRCSDVTALAERLLRRLRGVARVQRTLASTAGFGTDLCTAVGELASAVVESHQPAGGIRLELSLDDVEVEGQLAWRLSTVIAELMTNALRHGISERGGRIRVGVERRGYDLVCSVEDDGKGAGAWVSSNSGLGGPLVDRIAAACGGTVNRQTSTAGTRVEVSVPLAPSPAPQRSLQALGAMTSTEHFAGADLPS